EAGIGERIRNLAFIVPEGSYTDWAARATTARNRPNNNYVWRITLRPDAITADNVGDVRAGLVGLENRLAASIPGLYVLDPMLNVLDRFTTSVASVEGPVVLLSGAVLILMLYHLVATSSLVLEQSAGEWALLASRGASIAQLVRLQAISMGALAVCAAAAGPFLAAILLQIMVRIGPLAIAGQSGGALAALPGIPPIASILSAVAGIAAILALTLPAIPAAQRGLSRFKQLVARPPEQPLWARYGLDLLLALIGLGFIARLLFFVEGDAAATLALLVQDPGALIRLLIETANRSGGLNDPLNLLGPALLLTGLALLWLRLFPRLIALVGRFIGRGDGLAGPLSVWSVGRDPGRYAQLVLLLIGTLALGTAALALADTRDRGAWRAAMVETGGALALDLDPAQAAQTDWANLPGVAGAASLIRLDTQPQPGVVPATLLGVEPDALAAAFPETRSALAPLVDAEPVMRPPRRWGQGVTPISVYPAVINTRLAEDAGRLVSLSGLPLSIGDEAESTLTLPGGVAVTLNYRVVGIVDDFPSLAGSGHRLILNAAHLAEAVGAGLEAGQPNPTLPNQAWLDAPARLPPPELEAQLAALPGVIAVRRAWEPYVVKLGEPLPAAITGILYAGFWVSLVLSLLDFGYYLAVTARRRALSYAVLRALGWKAAAAWSQMAIEQALLVVPALLVGVVFGILFAYLILPFLALAGGATLALPGGGVAVLLAALLVGFGLLTSAASLYLARLNVNQTLRLGEE
ncbi:MAG: ABC transporter permease, partial [Anaerolineae bacterium]|nr:ABC transporter permease [Anaerolineae bacterium]